jgi:threonine dehydrogenase-like Zn-dependent dehydrogenase
MVRQGGRIGLLGVPSEKVIEQIPFKYLCRNEIAIFGSKANPNVSDKVLSLVALASWLSET